MATQPTDFSKYGYTLDQIVLHFLNSDNGSGFRNNTDRRDQKLNASEFTSAIEALAIQLEKAGIDTGITDMGKFSKEFESRVGTQEIDLIALEKSIRTTDKDRDGRITLEQLGFNPQMFSAIESGTYQGPVVPSTILAPAPEPKYNGKLPRFEYSNIPTESDELSKPSAIDGAADTAEPRMTMKDMAKAGINIKEAAQGLMQADTGAGFSEKGDGILDSEELIQTILNAAKVENPNPDYLKGLETGLRANPPSAMTILAALTQMGMKDHNQDGKVTLAEMEQGIDPRLADSALEQAQNLLAQGR